jgi:hypothetical protein
MAAMHDHRLVFQPVAHLLAGAAAFHASHPLLVIPAQAEI